MKKRAISELLLSVILISVLESAFITQGSICNSVNSANTRSESDGELLDTLADGSKAANLTFDRPNQLFTWEKESAFSFASHGGKAIPICDIEKDGQDEFLIANATYQDSFVRVFRNSVSVADLPYTGFFNEVVVGDSDDDGQNEVLIATSSGQVFMYGSDYMLEDTILVTGSNIGSVVVGDADGDGRSEVVIADNTNGLARIFRHNGQSYVEIDSLRSGLAWDVKVKYLVHGVTTGPGNSLVIQGAGVARAFLYYSGGYHEKTSVTTDASKRPDIEANIVIEDATNEGENKLVVGKNVYRPSHVGGLELVDSLSVLDAANQIKSIAAGHVPNLGNVVVVGTAASFEIHWWDGNAFRRIYDEYESSSNECGCEGVGIGDIDNDGNIEVLAHRIGRGEFVVYELKRSHYEETVYLKIQKKAVVESAHISLKGHKGQQIVLENSGSTLQASSLIWGLSQEFRLKENVELAGVELHLARVQFNTSYVEVELGPLQERANTSELVDEERWYQVRFPSIPKLNAGEDYWLYLKTFGQSNIFWYGTWRIGWHFRLFEEKYPANLGLDVASTLPANEWSHIGELNESFSPQVADLNASLINNYLATSIADADGNVMVPLLLQSDSAGNLEISDIQVLYDVDVTAPETTDNYDGAWHSEDFDIILAATDDKSGVRTIYYRINEGSLRTVAADGQPNISVERTNNRLEYWSIDNVGNEELPHRITGEIRLDKTAPNADAGIDRVVAEDTTVAFNASASTDENGIVSCTWTFNDATQRVLTGENPSYVFAAPGTYMVTLSVTDPAGNAATDTVTITVFDTTPPVADAGHNQTIYARAEASFNAGGSNDNVGITSYEWSFGDETTGSGKTTNHTYLAAGEYVLTLTVRDAAGNIATDSITVTVLPSPADEAFQRALAIVGAAIALIGAATAATLISRRKKNKNKGTIDSSRFRE